MQSKLSEMRLAVVFPEAPEFFVLEHQVRALAELADLGSFGLGITGHADSCADFGRTAEAAGWTGLAGVKEDLAGIRSELELCIGTAEGAAVGTCATSAIQLGEPNLRKLGWLAWRSALDGQDGIPRLLVDRLTVRKHLLPKAAKGMLQLLPLPPNMTGVAGMGAGIGEVFKGFFQAGQVVQPTPVQALLEAVHLEAHGAAAHLLVVAGRRPHFGRHDGSEHGVTDQAVGSAADLLLRQTNTIATQVAAQLSDRALEDDLGGAAVPRRLTWIANPNSVSGNRAVDGMMVVSDPILDAQPKRRSSLLPESNSRLHLGPT